MTKLGSDKRQKLIAHLLANAAGVHRLRREDLAELDDQSLVDLLGLVTMRRSFDEAAFRALDAVTAEPATHHQVGRTADGDFLRREALRACDRTDLIEAIAIMDETADRRTLHRASIAALADRAQRLGLTAATATALAEIPPPPSIIAALGRGQRGGSMRTNDTRTDEQKRADFITAIVEAFAFERDAVSSWPPARIVRVGLMAEQALELKRQAVAVGPEYAAQPAAATGNADAAIAEPTDLVAAIKASRAQVRR